MRLHNLILLCRSDLSIQLSKMLKRFFYLFIISLISTTANAQTFGFGCLGLVGGYGGYSYQKYKPTGLNNFISDFNLNKKASLTSPMKEFGEARGFRAGINFFRANFKGVFVTAKGFYESLQEKHDAVNRLGDNSTANYIYEVKLQNYGLGIDVGIDITKFIGWKIFDVALHFNNVSFSQTENLPGETNIKKFNHKPTALSYSIATGVILSLIENYISIEGLAGVTILKITDLKTDQDELLTATQNSTTPMNNFIESGGFTAVVQLNVGFPL